MEHATSIDKKNYLQQKFEAITDGAGNALRSNNDFASYAAPTPDRLQSWITAVSHLGMFSCAMGLALFLLPVAIQADCSYHNDTENGYNSTQTYDCNITTFLLHSSMGALGAFVLGVFAYWIGHRWNNNTVQYNEGKSLIEKNYALSCCAPSSDKLQASVKFATPFSGTALFGVATTLLAWAAMIKIGCNHVNNEIRYNNTDIYDCHIATLAKKSSIGGAVFFAPGAIMCLVAYLVYRLDGSVERNVQFLGEEGRPPFTGRQERNEIDVSTAPTSDSKLDEEKAYAIKYTELYLTKFFESYKEAYVLVRLSMQYNHEMASRWAATTATGDAERYAREEGLKAANKIDASARSGESEPLSLENSIGTNTPIIDPEKLKQVYPNWYRHKAREGYILKFSEKHEGKAITNVDLIERLQKEAIKEGKDYAIESITGYLENLRDGWCDDDEMSFDEARRDG